MAQRNYDTSVCELFFIAALFIYFYFYEDFKYKQYFVIWFETSNYWNVFVRGPDIEIQHQKKSQI